MTLSWKPRRYGSRYCAPACGHGCQYAEYQEAEAAAAALVKTLGAGWKPVVHENLGWHYSATKGEIEIVYSKHSHSFTAYFNAAHQTIGTAKSPRLAADRAIAAMASYVQSLIDSIEVVSARPVKMNAAGDGELNGKRTASKTARARR